MLYIAVIYIDNTVGKRREASKRPKHAHSSSKVVPKVYRTSDDRPTSSRGKELAYDDISDDAGWSYNKGSSSRQRSSSRHTHVYKARSPTSRYHSPSPQRHGRRASPRTSRHPGYDSMSPPSSKRRRRKSSSHSPPPAPHRGRRDSPLRHGRRKHTKRSVSPAAATKSRNTLPVEAPPLPPVEDKPPVDKPPLPPVPSLPTLVSPSSVGASPALCKATPTSTSGDVTPSLPEEPVRPRAWGERCIDAFEVLSQIGEGTYGKVFKAKNNSTGDIVALKMVRTDKEKEKEGFPFTAVREIKILKQLHHGSIIQLIDVITDKPKAVDFRNDQGEHVLFLYSAYVFILI